MLATLLAFCGRWRSAANAVICACVCVSWQRHDQVMFCDLHWLLVDPNAVLFFYQNLTGCATLLEQRIDSDKELCKYMARRFWQHMASGTVLMHTRPKCKY